MRIRRSVGFVVVALLALVGLMGAALPAVAAAARISVTPAKNLVDGQVVHVSAIDYPPNTSLGVVECGPNPTSLSSCDARTSVLVTTGPHGSATTPLLVARNIVIRSPKPGTKIDCNVAACTIGVGTLNFAVKASYPITFNKSAPLAPKLQIGLTVSPNGTVNTTSHVATVGGTATCNRPSFFQLSGQIQQLIPFQGVWLVSTSFITVPQLLCTAPSVPWSVKVGDLASSFGGIIIGFKVGNASAQVFAFGHSPGSSMQLQQPVNATVHLTASS